MTNKGAIAGAVTILLWSSAFSMIRTGLESYSPLSLALFRFAVASGVFIIYAICTKMRLPSKSDLIPLFGLSLAGISIYHACLNIGEVSVTSGTASFIIATAPVFTTMLSSIVLREKIRPKAWAGLGISLAGSAVMALGSGGFTINSGTLYILVSAISTAVFFVYQKPFFARYSPIELTAYVTWLGTLPLFAFAPQLVREIGHASISSSLAAIYIGVFPAAVAYASWSIALSQLSASKASSLLYLNPPLAVLFGFAIRHEIPTALQLMGGCIALSGVLLVNSRSKHRTTQESEKREAV